MLFSINLKATTLVAAASIAASAVAGVTGVLSYFQGKLNEKKIVEVHYIINSRMDELLKVSRETSKAEGVLQEQTDQARRDGKPAPPPLAPTPPPAATPKQSPP